MRNHAKALADRLFQFALNRGVEGRLRMALQTNVDDAELVGLLAALDDAGELVVVSQPSETRVEILCTMGLKTL